MWTEPQELLQAIPSAVWQMFLVGVGAFLGGWFAFRWERYAKQREKRLANIQAGRRAQFELLAQRFFIGGLWTQFLERLASKSSRWYKLPKILLAPPERGVDLDSLMFALEDNTTLLGQLFETQQEFATVLGLLKSRNESYAEYLRRLAASETEGRVPTSESEVVRLVGRDAVAELKSLTDSLYKTVTRAKKIIRKDFIALEVYLETHYPGVDFLPWEQPPARLPEKTEPAPTPMPSTTRSMPRASR